MATEKYKIPAMFSLMIPGAGQCIKKHYSKAFLIWLIMGILGYSLYKTIIVPLLFWVWNVYDAYRSND
jgi:TM2 domain-containing membrane protein YozV